MGVAVDHAGGGGFSDAGHFGDFGECDALSSSLFHNDSDDSVNGMIDCATSSVRGVCPYYTKTEGRSECGVGYSWGNSNWVVRMGGDLVLNQVNGVISLLGMELVCVY